jgi:two-component system sensor histidine kinase ChvG
MESDIVLARNEEGKRIWPGRWMLLHRILAVNIFALAILAGSIFYLDGFRHRLAEQGIVNTRTEARLVADSFALADPRQQQALLTNLGRHSRTRLRIFAGDGRLLLDSWTGAEPTYDLRDPGVEGRRKDFARKLDNAFDAMVGAARPPPLLVPEGKSLGLWPEAETALKQGRSETMVRRAPEGTLFLSAAAPVAGGKTVVLLTRNARNTRRIVREERTTLGLVLLGTILLSGLLSLFLARTIALPLRRLARSAQRVRLGRAREVRVPRLPARRDEIGLLARALSDMSQALRNRIDATEAFAAEVTHELKNPLASLRSAVDSLERVEDGALRRRLLEIVRHDVARLDRLIVDIAEVSRLDAELSHARFEPVDLGALIEAMTDSWEPRAATRNVRVAFARPRAGSTIVQGDDGRLARAIDNLVDNAISFSPAGGLVEIAAARVGPEVVISVEDEGPGVPPAARREIFRRFHSLRPESDGFGRHSGLGLAIAKTTIEGHDGVIAVEDRRDGRPGARFVIRFPDPA